MGGGLSAYGKQSRQIFDFLYHIMVNKDSQRRESYIVRENGWGSYDDKDLCRGSGTIKKYLFPNVNLTRQFRENCNIPTCVWFCYLMEYAVLSLSPLRHGNSRRRVYAALSVTALIGLVTLTFNL